MNRGDRMNQEYIMAIDQGTTSTRAIIYNHDGEIIGKGQKEITQYYPQDGWMEHDPVEIWNSVQSVIGESFIGTELLPQHIKALGITNQRETTIIWDRVTGEPIYNAIVWQSRQSSPIASNLVEAGYSEMIHAKTGLIVDAYFSATKIRWILDKVPGAQTRAENGELLFGTVETWLLWNFTKGEKHLTDVTNASRTMLLNIHTLAWDEELLAILNIPKRMLPQVVSNSEIMGYTHAFNFYDLKVPIAAMAGDQQASLFGQLVLEEGMVKNTYGTGSFIVMNTGTTPKLSQNKLLTTIGYQVGNSLNYALEGSIFVAGSSVQWLRDGLKLFEHASESENFARLATSSDEVYVVPAFVGLGAPYWDYDVRGAMFGLTRATSNFDIAKATLQAVAYQVRDVIDTMQDDTGMPIKLLKVDGGASDNQFLMQFQSDVLDIALQKSLSEETTARGVAFMAGLAVGYWNDIEELKRLEKLGSRIEPIMEPERRESLYKGWKIAVEAARIFKPRL